MSNKARFTGLVTKVSCVCPPIPTILGPELCAAGSIRDDLCSQWRCPDSLARFWDLERGPKGDLFSKKREEPSEVEMLSCRTMECSAMP